MCHLDRALLEPNKGRVLMLISPPREVPHELRSQDLLQSPYAIATLTTLHIRPRAKDWLQGTVTTEEEAEKPAPGL